MAQATPREVEYCTSPSAEQEKIRDFEAVHKGIDPCQPEDRQLNNDAIEQLRCELLDSNHPCLLRYFNPICRQDNT